MQLLETVTDVETVMERLQKQDILIVPILTDTKTHPAVNSVCVLCISTSDESFLIGFDHNEMEVLDKSVLLRLASSQRVWAADKKALFHSFPGLATDDVASLEYLVSGEVTKTETFYTTTHRHMMNVYDTAVKVNKSIPIMQHIAFLEGYVAHLWTVINNHVSICDTSAYKWLNEQAIPALAFIESNGIHVDRQLAVQRYPDKRLGRHLTTGLLHSEYNLFTKTGRCSNKFAGINYAALNKSDGTRKMFTSRHETGMMVMVDFESFHLRLIADMIGYEFPTDIPVHQYLGQQYFDKSVLTPEEYDEGKKITFRLLYGEDRSDHVPEFFKAVYQYIDMLMVLLNKNGYILSPYNKRHIERDKIEEPTPSKVFNYMVQLAETEVNLTSINKMKTLFENTQSKPMLYTYDSILFDYDVHDGKKLLIDAIAILSHDNKFPMRVYYGKTYDDLKEVSV